MADLKNNIHIKDIEEGDNQDFYKTFKEKLIDVERFPSAYTFKFIVKTDSNKIELVKAVFEHPSVKFSKKSSSAGKYTSISIECFVKDADEVINYYKKVSKIPDVMML